MKNANVTNDACLLLSWHVVLRNGISVPLSQVTKPNIKYRQPTRNNRVVYERFELSVI